jgi:hypothetical protein
MDLATFREWVNTRDEVETIANEIISERFPDNKDFTYYLDDMEFYPSQDKVSIRIAVNGKFGWTDNEQIHVSFDGFCDPKYLLDIIEDSC